MRSAYFFILALVITLTSVAWETPVMEFSQEQLASLQSIPSWEADSLRPTELKHSEKNNLIAQDFIPIVLIAEQWDSQVDFFHYIPLYNLVRQKEYFLLI